MFLFSATAQELRQKKEKIKHCLSKVPSQRRGVCLPLETTLHAFYEMTMPTFSLTTFVPARKMAPNCLWLMETFQCASYYLPCLY